MPPPKKYAIEDIVHPDHRAQAERNFLCAICHCLLDDAVQVTCCNTLFCRACLEPPAVLACPNCRKDFKNKNFKSIAEANPFVDRMLKDVGVICPFSSEAEAAGAAVAATHESSSTGGAARDASGSSGGEDNPSAAAVGGAAAASSSAAAVGGATATSSSAVGFALFPTGGLLTSSAVAGHSDSEDSDSSSDSEEDDEEQPRAKRRRVEAGPQANGVPVLAAPVAPGGPPSVPCKWQGSYGDFLSKHLAECPCAPVACPRKCGAAQMKRYELAAHDLVCKKLRDICHICGEGVKPGQMDEHRRQKADEHVRILEGKLETQKAEAKQLREDQAAAKASNNIREAHWSVKTADVLKYWRTKGTRGDRHCFKSRSFFLAGIGPMRLGIRGLAPRARVPRTTPLRLQISVRFDAKKNGISFLPELTCKASVSLPSGADLISPTLRGKGVGEFFRTNSNHASYRSVNMHIISRSSSVVCVCEEIDCHMRNCG